MQNLDQLIEAVAEIAWGKPTRSSPRELRFGAHGSKTLDRAKKRWFDHEAQVGGGVVSLIQQIVGTERGAVSRFLKTQFNIEGDAPDHEDMSAFRRPDEPQKIVATYEYQDETGRTTYRVHRMGPRKTFWQQLPDGRKPSDDPDFMPLLFRLPQLIASGNAPVFIVEGEKDVLRLAEHGLIATCNHGGAGSWDQRHAKWLQDRQVIILPDNDEAGRNHANKVAASLTGIARAVKLIELAGLPDKGDVSDWLDEHTIDELRAIVKASQPITRPLTPIPALSMRDVMSMEPVEWLIQDMIPEGSLSMIFGASGSGKTFLVLSMLCAVAHGKRWFNKGAQKGCCILVAGEGVAGLRKRLHAYHVANNLEPDAPLFIIPRAINLMRSEDVDGLIDTIEICRAGQPVKMIVIDTLARSMQGDADENSAQAMGEAIAEMDRIKSHFGAAVVPIHHTGKDADRSRGGRGSSALIGALDASIFVARHEDGLVEVDIQKQKDGEQIAPLWFRSKKIEFQQEWWQDMEDSIVLEMCEEKPQEAKSKSMSPAQKRVLDALTEALIRYGRVPSVEGITWHCVSEDEWRSTALDMTISGSGQDADRKAFARAAQSLVEKHYVEKRSGYVWNVDFAQRRVNPDDL
jgi:hypothetical protein